VIHNLAQGLTARGHEVRIFTVGTSSSPSMRGFLFQDPPEPLGQSVPEAAHVLAAYDALRDVDVIHDHTMLGPLVANRFRGTLPPVVTTNHGPFTDETRIIFREIARTSAVVAISADQASRAGGVPIAAVIHHGVDLDTYRPGTGDGDHLVFVGRMNPEKGVDRAIRIARAAGRPLRIIAKMREPAERAYFERAVRPLLSSEHVLLEELPLADRVEVVGSAYGLVNPIAWPEPFGLVMAESLAMGTPVLAYPSGAAPEIVDDGRTGFLREDVLRAARAVPYLAGIDRVSCRASAETRFSVARMAADYENLFESLL
jgi:glycosyltransferase involved in cell wall biosynthesis